MSNPATQTTPDKRSLEVYHSRRLRKAAAVGTRAGKFLFSHCLKQWLGKDKPCTQLALIQSPQESTVVKPEAMLPLLSSFSKPYCLEIFRNKEEQIAFQIAYQNEDEDVLANMRALFGSHLNVSAQNVEAWNTRSGLSDQSFLSYLLPVNSLYPLSFTLNWQEADIVSLLLEKLKTFSQGELLVQYFVKPLPDSGQRTSTDVLAALNYLPRLVESFRLNLIKERFNQPLTLFALRLLGQNQATMEAVKRSLSVLNAPFNHFKEVKLTGKKKGKVAQAVLERREFLSDGVSLLSFPELAGLWHLDLQPDFFIERANVREVATAKLTTTDEPGRTLGWHTLRGKTYPVLLPYKARNNHLSVFGKSQSGKSTALIRVSTQDIEAGLGVAFVDQHDLPLRVLPHIPRKRWDDVILISPRLMETTGRMFPLNLFDLGRTDAFAVEFVCETLKEILGRAFTTESIGPRTSYILDIATTALLKDKGKTRHTVLDLSRVLLDKAFRYELADRLDDEDTREKLIGFDKLPKDSFAAPLNKLQLFSRDSIRPMVAAKENGFNTARGKNVSLLDAKPIVICDLADIPHASAVAIGSIVLALLQLEAFKRNPQEENELFNCYVDEAAAFLNLENADLITRTFQECAKFRMSLALINQSYDTVPPTVRKTLSTNVAALMYFSMGIGSGDAKIAKAELHGEFEEEELNRLPVGRAAVRLGSDVFSIFSPDFKTPQNPNTEELIRFSLSKRGVATKNTADSIPQTKDSNTAESTSAERKVCGVAKPKPIDLEKLQGEQKRQAMLRLLAVSGLVPLTDLCEIFFSSSPAYGRQVLKKMAGEGLVTFVKLGKRLAYCLTSKGGETLKKKEKVQPFVLPDEKLWEHAAMTGSIAARFCALAAIRGATLSIERETNWHTVRPDLTVRWNEGARSTLWLVEADRATESLSTFQKEKLEPLSKVFAGRERNSDVRLLVVTTTKKRIETLRKTFENYSRLAAIVRFTTLKDWPVGKDIFEGNGQHRTAKIQAEPE